MNTHASFWEAVVGAVQSLRSSKLRSFLTLLGIILATTTLICVGFAFGATQANPNGLPPGFAPYLWGCLVWALGLAVGGPTGYAMNPARDFGPRVAHAVLPISGKGGSDWGYALVPILGPLAGGAIAAVSIHLIKY